MVTMEWAAHIVRARYEAIGEETVHWAKTRILDILGCIVAGTKAQGSRELVDLVLEWGGKKEAQILVYGEKVPASNASMVNAILARSFDFGPVHPEFEGKGFPGHISETSIPCALAVGEALGKTGKEILTALIVGEDLASRLLAASEFDLSQGFDCIGTANAFASCAISARLMGLDEVETRNAFGILLTLIGGSLQAVWDGCTSFKLVQGVAAKNGVLAASLAKKGWTGPKDALFSRHGYFSLFTKGVAHEEVLTRDLGTRFYTDSSIKPYPSCRGTHPYIDCALAIQKKHGIRGEEIEEVTLYFPPKGLSSFISQPFELGPFPQGSAIFSVQYTVAVALLEGRLLPSHLEPEAISRPDIVSFAKAIRLEESTDLLPLSGRVKVRTKDGREIVEFQPVPRGHRRASPLSREEIERKFLNNLTYTGRGLEHRAERILELVEKFEELPDIGRLLGIFS
jgi:2-methylcitrate dehydratase PrpD